MAISRTITARFKRCWTARLQLTVGLAVTFGGGCLAVGQTPVGSPAPQPVVNPIVASVGVPEIVTRETLEDAWRVALQSDQRLEAGRWNVLSAASTQSAAEAERYPSLQVGGDY